MPKYGNFTKIAVVAAVAALLSPPGRSVVTSFRKAVGVQRAETELFSLPAPGHLLVSGRGGTWIVIGREVRACLMKVGTTMPYWPVWRGPTVLKSRTMTVGSFRSRQYARARNSSIAFEQA